MPFPFSFSGLALLAASLEISKPTNSTYMARPEPAINPCQTTTLPFLQAHIHLCFDYDADEPDHLVKKS